MAGYPGQQGRKPKAATIVERLRQGQTNASERTRLPAAPPHLTPVARREWRRLGKLLMAAGLLGQLDATALGLYCTAYARLLEAEAMLHGPPGHCAACDPRVERETPPTCRGTRHAEHPYGYVVANRLGQPVPSSYLKIANEAHTQMVKLLAEFGMTPASRGRIPRDMGEAKRSRMPVPVPDDADQTVDPREMLTLVVGGKAS